MVDSIESFGVDDLSAEVVVDDLGLRSPAASQPSSQLASRDGPERGGDLSDRRVQFREPSLDQGGRAGPRKPAVRELERRLEKSMLESFPRDVWSACEVPHPEALREQAQAWDTDDRPDDSLPRSRRSMMEVFADRLKETRAKHNVAFEMDLARYIKEVEEARQAAKLARDTGWDVLDVEEVRDIFHSFASDGAIDVASAAFAALLKHLYSGSGAEEVTSICEEFAKQGIGAKLSDGSDSEDDSDSSSDSGSAPRKILSYEITFANFFKALTTWLNRQDSATKGRRCTLRRFEVPDPTVLGSLVLGAGDVSPQAAARAATAVDPPPIVMERRKSLRGASMMASLLGHEEV